MTFFLNIRMFLILMTLLRLSCNHCYFSTRSKLALQWLALFILIGKVSILLSIGDPDWAFSRVLSVLPAERCKPRQACQDTRSPCRYLNPRSPKYYPQHDNIINKTGISDSRPQTFTGSYLLGAICERGDRGGAHTAGSAVMQKWDRFCGAHPCSYPVGTGGLKTFANYNYFFIMP
jgi:hypothetical protein